MHSFHNTLEKWKTAIDAFLRALWDDPEPRKDD
jgi:hypothetical protein